MTACRHRGRKRSFAPPNGRARILYLGTNITLLPRQFHLASACRWLAMPRAHVATRNQPPLPPVHATRANGGTRGRHQPVRGRAATWPRRDAGAFRCVGSDRPPPTGSRPSSYVATPGTATTPVNATRANGWTRRREWWSAGGGQPLPDRGRAADVHRRPSCERSAAGSRPDGYSVRKCSRPRSAMML